MILDDIVADTKRRLEVTKALVPYELMKKEVLEMPKDTGFPFEKTLAEDGISFICEVKKASPSKGVIATDFPYLEIAKDYEEAGASAISVLTEPNFFQGSNIYLSEISDEVNIPVLRKDFIVDDYQIYEAKLIGADAILLICVLLDTKTIREYIKLCDDLGLSALVEAHTDLEVESAITAGARIIGVNNRNLKTFEVDLNTCIDLRSKVPANILYVAESGISAAEDINRLKKAAVDAVLIGESMMRSNDKTKMLAALKGE